MLRILKKIKVAWNFFGMTKAALGFNRQALKAHARALAIDPSVSTDIKSKLVQAEWLVPVRQCGITAVGRWAAMGVRKAAELKIAFISIYR